MNIPINTRRHVRDATPPLSAVTVLLLLLLLLSIGARGQTLSPAVSSSGGAYHANASGSLSLTVGQPASATLLSAGNTLTAGFQQPELLLVTGTVSPPLCVGSAVDVPYAVNGYFSSLNVFTAELSDAYGSFSSPTVIGSANGPASGTITATIPAFVTPGTGYRVRVVSSLPAFTGPDNGIDLTVHMPPSPAITVDPSPAVNPGGALNTIYLGYGPQSVTLAATSGYVSYSWYPTTFLSNPNIASPVISPTAEGTYLYTVTVTDANGCSGSAGVTITVIDVFGGNNNNLVTICLNGQTKQVNPNAVQALLGNGRATMGPCTPKIAVSPAAKFSLPAEIVLHQNYPNPFNPSTTIRYTLPREMTVRLRVFDFLGRELTTLVDGIRGPGTHAVQFHAAALAGGPYRYVLESEQQVVSRTMLLTK